MLTENLKCYSSEKLVSYTFCTITYVALTSNVAIVTAMTIIVHMV